MKKNPPAKACISCGRKGVKRLLLFLFGFRSGGLSSLRLGHALLELVHASRRINEFLLTRKERMANVANTHQNDGLGGAGLNHVAARATDFRVLIFRMNVSFHKETVQVNRSAQFDKPLFILLRIFRIFQG